MLCLTTGPSSARSLLLNKERLHRDPVNSCQNQNADFTDRADRILKTSVKIRNIRVIRVRPDNVSSMDQKLTTLDSEISVANLIGSINEAFKVLRSSSVTPRATEQAPQTYIETFPLTFSISSGRGGKPTP